MQCARDVCIIVRMRSIHIGVKRVNEHVRRTRFLDPLAIINYSTVQYSTHHLTYARTLSRDNESASLLGHEAVAFQSTCVSSLPSLLSLSFIGLLPVRKPLKYPLDFLKYRLAAFLQSS